MILERTQLPAHCARRDGQFVGSAPDASGPRDDFESSQGIQRRQVAHTISIKLNS
jgi:hypothetical protein